ncbi:6554_t:CDS:2 [Acaulospora colombiana]|uniref:6554_t:CDS:1 n=1 Tax=Acaulospora colombiana TaxID=27376 RepID=A0ACA9JY71_9GLOM|nr:6554_t:CDS:2 [Acaulospora colombiana]
MNLTAVSNRDRETLFVAVDDVIFVYSLSQFEELEENASTREPKEPIKKLGRDWNDSESHTINAIKVGMIGKEEVLVCVDDSGGVGMWYTSDLDRRPILLSNDESTWGIALQGPNRLLAVSSNSHDITIYNLKANMDLSEDANGHKGSPRSSASAVAPESRSAWECPLQHVTGSNRSNQSRDQYRQFPNDMDNNDDVPDVDIANTTALVHGVSNVRFDHLETEFEDGYLDTTAGDNIYSSSDLESDPDSNRQGDSENENEIESTVGLENRSENDSHTPVPETTSYEEWGEPTSEPHHVVNDDNGIERSEADSSPISRPSAPDVHRHIEYNTFNPPIPSYNRMWWSSNSPPYSPSSPQYRPYHPTSLQSSTNSSLSQPLLTSHPNYSSRSRENTRTSLTHSANLFSRENSRVSQSRSSPRHTPTLQQHSPLLSPNSLPHSSHSPTFSSPTSTHGPRPPNDNDELPSDTVTSSLTVGGTNEPGYRSNSPNLYSSGSREQSSPHSQRSPDNAIESLLHVYPPFSRTRLPPPHVPQLSERRRRVDVSQLQMSSRLRRSSNFRGSELPDDETTDEPVLFTIDHFPPLQSTNSKNLNASSRDSKRRQQIKHHTEELILFSTQYDLYLLDPKSELRTLDCKRGVTRDPRRGFVLAGHDRLNMVEASIIDNAIPDDDGSMILMIFGKQYIPELSLAIVASQKGKVALIRILK